MSHRITLLALSSALLPVPLAGQQLQMFPTGPYMTHCRGPESPDTIGGDDDYYNVWYFELDLSRVQPDGTPAHDFYIHIFDGACVPVANSNGIQDSLGSLPRRTAYEFRLYGGANAARMEEVVAGDPRLSWGGTQIDIDTDDPDPADRSLRTDDPDDIDGDSPEDLRAGGDSVIGVDMDGDPGDLAARPGHAIYKLVVDAQSQIRNASGTGNNAGDDWNRYKLIATRDLRRTDADGIRLMTYELTIAGRPDLSATNANLAFEVPATGDNRIDPQTLDLDSGGNWNGTPTFMASRLSTFTRLYPDDATFESGQQYVGSSYMWSSVLQGTPPPSVAAGNGQRGSTVSTVNEVGKVWVYDVDPKFGNNPFSFRLRTSVVGQSANWLPISLVSTFTAYGEGPFQHYGAGLPRSTLGVQNDYTLHGEGAPANAPCLLLFGATRANLPWSVPPWTVNVYVTPGAATSATLFFLFDPNGLWQQTFPVPGGLFPGSFYSQLFAFDAAGNRLLHSNGLKITLLQ